MTKPDELAFVCIEYSFTTDFVIYLYSYLELYMIGGFESVR